MPNFCFGMGFGTLVDLLRWTEGKGVRFSLGHFAYIRKFSEIGLESWIVLRFERMSSSITSIVIDR